MSFRSESTYTTRTASPKRHRIESWSGGSLFARGPCQSPCRRASTRWCPGDAASPCLKNFLMPRNHTFENRTFEAKLSEAKANSSCLSVRRGCRRLPRFDQRFCTVGLPLVAARLALFLSTVNIFDALFVHF